MREQIRDLVLQINASYPITEIALFGSQATGEATPESDWDVSVILTNRIHDAKKCW